MIRVHALEEPDSVCHSPPSASGAFGIGALMVIVAAKMIVLALDPIGIAVVAPLLLVALVGGVVVVVTVAASLGELRAIARDAQTRVIHGLEHATINLLLQDGHRILSGQTEAGHFEVEAADGNTTVDAVRLAARSAIRRVADGEHFLAFDRRCGTSMLIALTLASLLLLGTFATGLIYGVSLRPLSATMIFGAIVAVVLARPLGLIAQRMLTVSTQYQSASVLRVIRGNTESGGTWFRVAVRVRLAGQNPEPQNLDPG